MGVYSLNIDNPFVQKDDTDVIFIVEGQKLYGHSQILGYKSTVFRNILKHSSNKEIVIENTKIKDVIVFLKFLYPEHEIVLSRQINFKQFLTLCKEYGTEDLLVKAQEFLIDSNIYDGEIWKFSMGFALASQFGLERLKESLESKMITYCSRLHPDQNNKIAFPYNASLCLHEYYNLPKLVEYIDTVLQASPDQIIEVQSNGGHEGLGGVAGLVIAEKYNLNQLRMFLMKSITGLKSYSQIEHIEGFCTLPIDSRWDLLQKVLTCFIPATSVGILDHLYKTNPRKEPEALQTTTKEAAVTPLVTTSPQVATAAATATEAATTEATITEATTETTTAATTTAATTTEATTTATTTTAATTEAVITTQLTNPFTNKEDMDVILTVEGLKLHLHSALLCHCSPVFKAMLQGNFKEANTKQIELKDKKAESTIEFFEFFVETKTLTEQTKYDELLALCQEYQVDWLKEKVENYLIKVNTINTIDRLLLAEKYNLNKLMMKIMAEQPATINTLEEDKRFLQLSKSTIYKLERQQIISKMGNSQPTVLSFLDNLFG